jgi:hypothetical protein
MLPHDFDLTSAHLQALSSREAIVAFFAQLGYNTEARLKQTSAALGFTESLAHKVTHVERVADHENGELQVYLLEMKHVTVALTQALARALRNRVGNFLLVLTADYERIDFVLMDLVRPEGSVGGIGLLASMPAEKNGPGEHSAAPATGSVTVSGQGKYVGRDGNSINVTMGSRATNKTTYNTAALRELLNAAFSNEELTTLCFDYFPEVHNNFSAGMSKGQKIQQLLDYCTRREQIPTLLPVIQAHNPVQFARYEGRLRQ